MAKMHSFDVELAEKYGAIESIILSNLCFWIEKNIANRKNYHKGRYWVYNSATAFEKIFPYLNKDQIRRLLDKLNKEGALHIDSFNKIGYDRTLWYSVSDEVMEIYTGGKKTAESPSAQMGVTAQMGGTAQMGEWAENGTKPPETACPNGRMHFAESPDASAQTGECISRIRHIDLANSQDRSGGIASPIPDINQYKPSASDPPEAEKESQTELFKKLLLAIDRRFVFSEGFYGIAQEVMDNYGFGEGYCRWLYDECLKMEPDNIRGLYYTLFCKPEMLELYLSTGIKDTINSGGAGGRNMQCPVCGFIFTDIMPECPSCHTAQNDMNDKSLVERQKRFFELNDEQKEKYRNELFAITKMFGKISSNEYRSMKRDLEERYGLASAALKEAGVKKDDQ